jgi:hypothetical protein
MDSSPLWTLPPELIFRILDFLHPGDYSGFSCTCKRALSLVNQALDVPQYRSLTKLENRRSRTAAFVEINRRCLNGELPSVASWEEGAGGYYGYDGSEDAYL